MNIAPPEAFSGKEGTAARSPGTRHRHYAPDARVVIVGGPGEARAASRPPRAYIGLQAPAHPEAFALTRTCDGMEAYARALFAFFREADAAGCRVICAQRVDEARLGRALMDRLRRASAATHADASP